MSTLATTRPPLSALSSLSFVSPVVLATQLASAGAATSSSTTTAPPFGLFRHTMHPDNLLLQKHGVTSPRLSAASINLNPSAAGNVKCCGGAMSGPEQLYGEHDEVEEEEEEATREEEEDHVMIDDVVGADGREAAKEVFRSNKKREMKKQRSKHVDVCDVGDNVVADLDEDAAELEDAAPDDDAVSLCSSEGSELSVGQEDPLESSRSDAAALMPCIQKTRRLLAVNDMMSLCRPSAFSSVSTAASVVEVSDARSSASTDDALQLDEERPVHNASVAMDPFAMAASALRMPVPLVPRSNSVQFQEELLRKSHLYAEELMKQQMQLMAAARVSASAFTLRQPSSALGGSGFAPHHQHPPHLQASSRLGDLPNFSGIHSHLSAISKMSQLGVAAAAAAAAAAAVSNQQTCAAGSDALAKLTAFGMSQAQTQTPATAAASNLNQLQAQMQAHLPFINNNLQEPTLKFSIDNILKADFGRRITEPLKRGGRGGAVSGTNGTRGTRSSQMYQQRSKKGGGAPTTSTTPMDLTSQMTAAAAAVATSTTTGSAPLPFGFSTTLANICSNSNDSSSTAVSSNYGNAELLKSPSSLTGATSACSVSPAPGGAGGMDGGKGGVDRDVATDGGSGGGGGSSSSSSTTSSNGNGGSGTGASSGNGPIVWPAWVYCTRYSDRPSSGPRAKKPKKPASEKGASPAVTAVAEDKRPRTAFSGSQLARLKHEFTENRYLTEKRRQQLSSELGLNEAQIKIWFQNKRAKLKKSSGTKNPLALQLMAQGLYNHSTVPLTREEEELQELQERENAAALSS